MSKRVLVCGAGGFIGNHQVNFLKEKGYWVRGVDVKYPEYNKSAADEFKILDLRHLVNCQEAIEGVNIVYQFAADMGGAGYIFTKEHDADIMHNSALINLHIAKLSVQHKIEKLFYSSSACAYSESNQMDPDNPNCVEDSAYPANPDSSYGWEKIFAEQTYLAFHRNYGLPVRIARFHNIYGPSGSWDNGKEKAPSAVIRKISETPDGGEIEIWGDGKQTRSFLYIDECLKGVDKLMNSDFIGPVNIGSEEKVTINQLVEYVKEIGGKPNITVKHIDGPQGVRGRTSDNKLIKEKLGWAPNYPLKEGLSRTYKWIKEQVDLGKVDAK